MGRLLNSAIEGVNGGGQERCRFMFVPNSTSDPVVYTSYVPAAQGAAPAPQPTKGSGLKSIKRLGVGLIGLQMDDTAPGAVIGFWVACQTGSALTGTVPNQTITGGNLAGYEFALLDAGGGLMVIQMFAAGGTTLTDPANDGSKVHLEIVFSKDPTNAY